MFKKIAIIFFLSQLLFCLIFALPSLAVEKNTENKPRGKYEIVGDLKEARKVRPIKVIKFFNFSCGHCYNFLKGEKGLLKRIGNKIH